METLTMAKKFGYSTNRKEFIKRIRKKSPVGLKLTKIGRIFKVKKYSASK